MNIGTFTRRNFAGRFAAVLSSVGLTGAVLAGSAQAAADDSIRKLGDDGKPADGKQMITPIVVHNGLIYVAGQGAHDPGPADQFEIGHHTTIVMDNVKKLVEAGGGTVDSILQLSVFLADIKYYDGMHDGRRGCASRKFAGGNQLHRGGGEEIASATVAKPRFHGGPMTATNP
jgi:enamine deaminase RidA (YjgF/YER057c/UK114 family)